MSLIALLVGFLAAGMLLILQTEERWWGGKLARQICEWAVRLGPANRRADLRDEFVDQLRYLQEDEGHGGVLFALELLVVAGRLRWREARREAEVPPSTTQELTPSTTVFEPSHAEAQTASIEPRTSVARLLRVWRTAIAGWTQAEVAEHLSNNVAEHPSTNKATISMWEHAKRGVTFEALFALDHCYSADGALADMAQAFGTPLGLPARRSWVRYPSGTSSGWALLRPGPERCRVDARFVWGPLSFRISEPCDETGILLQLPCAACDVTVAVQLDKPGWVDFGRGRAYPELGMPVHHVPASPVLLADVPVPSGLVSPSLANRFAHEPDFAKAVLQFLGARPDLVREAFATPLARGSVDEVLTVNRPHPDSAVPRFTGEQYRTLRNARSLTLLDAAELVTSLLPDEPVSADRIRRFERGAKPQAKQLRARLDYVYDAGGHTCNEPVDVRSYRSPFMVTFPRYWVGPVWFAFHSDQHTSAHVVIRRGSGACQRLTVVPGASVTCSCTSTDDIVTFEVECPYGWTVTAGLGARPAAPEVHLPSRRRDTDPGTEVHDALLSLFGRTTKDLEQFLLQHKRT